MPATRGRRFAEAVPGLWVELHKKYASFACVAEKLTSGINLVCNFLRFSFFAAKSDGIITASLKGSRQVG